MFDWISAHKDILQTLASVGSFLIWLIYAQLLYFGFRRQRRPRLIINRGKRKNLDALCVISNMSAEPIYLQHIMMTLETSKGDWTLDVSDHEADLEDDHSDQERTPDGRCTHQGPLDSGGFVHIGSFNALKQRIIDIAGLDDKEGTKGDLVLKAMCVRVIGTYCSENLPIGAERRFVFHQADDSCTLVPETWDTLQFSTRRQRRELKRDIKRIHERQAQGEGEEPEREQGD
ncbi:MULTISPECIES: hypothetical protein [Halomonas]|uniref:hypothetical protein n=1 Tax=Halomonas TaxID=2745 RepID=UPI001C97D073|nr:MULTISPECIES: hypothetical protein [Halomonas]MBY6207011.1 hypothetical protein [Halomonas sp. DP3Y7-2]MBY6230485.1 hypothetical protein [Halomonas sp. DP3Y7-1]MCA0918646.1 hypothetical protein [Halomonas denitrificans]